MTARERRRSTTRRTRRSRFADTETKGLKSDGKGGKTDGKGTENAKSPDASTSDGQVSVAGALAVNIELANAQAYVGDGLNMTAGGTLTLKSSTNVDGVATADGSAVNGATEFDPTKTVPTKIVDLTADTIDLGSDSKLKDGDSVTYSHGDGGTDIGGLKDGTEYFVHVVKDGVIQLYDTRADATAHKGAGKGLEDLTSLGAGTSHAFRGAGEAGTTVGVAVTVNYATNTNLAYIGSSTGGSKIIAGGLDIEATTAERKFAFNPAATVDLAHDSIALGDNNLRTGDSVEYHHGAGGADINGLTDGKSYFVNIGADGRTKLYGSADDAEAGGTQGLIDLKSVGSGTAHYFSDTTDRFDAESTSGAGGGKTGVAGSLAVNVALVHTEADLGSPTPTARPRQTSRLPAAATSR